MRIFFAGVNRDRAPLLIETGVRNFLASFEAPRLAEESVQALKVNHPGNAFLLDSGAFSAWNSGTYIDLKEYIAFAKDFIARHKAEVSFIYVANLDVIPGEQGKIPTHRQVEEAAREGWDNMLQMQAAGLTPVHIFHQGERFEWLEKLSRHLRYIGISPSNDASTKSKKIWMRKVFSIIKARNMTHGFAVTAKDLMWSFPWYSVDSTSWMAAQVWGKPIFSRGFEEQGLSSRVPAHVDYVLAENVRNLRRLQENITKFWARRGVAWDEDEKI